MAGNYDFTAKRTTQDVQHYEESVHETNRCVHTKCENNSLFQQTHFQPKRLVCFVVLFMLCYGIAFICLTKEKNVHLFSRR